MAAHLAEPAETAAARGRKRRAKTDRADAKLLCTLLDEGRLPECYIPPTEVLEYRDGLAAVAFEVGLSCEVSKIHSIIWRTGLKNRAPHCAAVDSDRGAPAVRVRAAVH